MTKGKHVGTILITTSSNTIGSNRERHFAARGWLSNCEAPIRRTFVCTTYRGRSLVPRVRRTPTTFRLSGSFSKATFSAGR